MGGRTGHARVVATPHPRSVGGVGGFVNALHLVFVLEPAEEPGQIVCSVLVSLLVLNARNPFLAQPPYLFLNLDDIVRLRHYTIPLDYAFIRCTTYRHRPGAARQSTVTLARRARRCHHSLGQPRK